MSGVEGGRQVRVALIGSGRMGSFHAGSLTHRIPGVQLVAVADPAPGAAERMAATFGAVSAYTDAAEVFADPRVDAVVIAAPARFHTDLIVAAAEAGKAVFCEKPGALTSSDLDRALAAVQASGVLLQIGFNRRFAPDNETLIHDFDTPSASSIRAREPSRCSRSPMPWWNRSGETAVCSTPPW